MLRRGASLEDRPNCFSERQRDGKPAARCRRRTLLAVLAHRVANAVEHGRSRLVSHAERPVKRVGTEALVRRAEQVESEQPPIGRDVCGLEGRPHRDRELSATRATPPEPSRHARVLQAVGRPPLLAAVGADRTRRPPHALEVLESDPGIGEPLVEAVERWSEVVVARSHCPVGREAEAQRSTSTRGAARGAGSKPQMKKRMVRSMPGSTSSQVAGKSGSTVWKYSAHAGIIL